MAIPSTASNFPSSLDSDTNLYLVHDSLRVKLVTDYEPGDTSITIFDENRVMSNFPPTGIITLTEQCSDIDERAISLHYSGTTDTSFTGLELLSDFADVTKPKDFTNVTLNVMSRHHNAIKNAVIAIETFVGVEGTTDTTPFGATVEGRLNFLTRLILTPRAWFSANKTADLVPLTVVFTDESFRLGDGDIVYTWNFGDTTFSSISIANISATSNPTILHTYTEPGFYDVTLTVSNEHGSDLVVFDNFINAKIPAPDEAVIDFVTKTGQAATAGIPVGGPFTTPPTIRTPIDLLVEVNIASGTNPATGRTFGGEAISNGGITDPIDEYTWALGDDLSHANQTTTKALYSAGGIYDIILRADTTFGAYRITKYENVIDVVEDRNIWLWTFPTANPEGNYDPLDFLTRTGNVTAHEFGLLSETFKTASESLTVSRTDSFLTGTNNEFQAKTEFRRNVGFTPRGTTTSGQAGSAMLYWASQGTPVAEPGPHANHEIKIREYNGFNDTYASQSPIKRPWNWINLNSDTTSYFLFGALYNPGQVPNHNFSHQVKSSYNLSTFTNTDTNLTLDDYGNGAQELQEHVSIFDGAGDATNGYFAVYRTAWKDSAGYILRNSGVGEFFRLRSFYKTTGTIGDEFQTITKLTDMTGPTKVEGQLVALSDGLFFFNNTGNISAYNTTSGVWETGGASSSSALFRSLQDTTVGGFDNTANTLLATTDDDRVAYLSYDYSPQAFTKFSSLDLSFSSVGPRPGWQNSNKFQFIIGMY